jgi:hypothetical protein
VRAKHQGDIQCRINGKPVGVVSLDRDKDCSRAFLMCCNFVTLLFGRDASYLSDTGSIDGDHVNWPVTAAGNKNGVAILICLPDALYHLVAPCSTIENRSEKHAQSLLFRKSEHATLKFAELEGTLAGGCVLFPPGSFSQPARSNVSGIRARMAIIRLLFPKLTISVLLNQLKPLIFGYSL